jgi:hypothetical protein
MGQQVKYQSMSFVTGFRNWRKVREKGDLRKEISLKYFYKWKK